jgi:hypothetical protein
MMIDFLRALFWLPPRPRKRTYYPTSEERYAELALSYEAAPVHVSREAKQGIADLERMLINYRG